MKVEKVSFQNYRNLADGEISPSGGINIVYGENGQGKTNLLEAIFMCSGIKSFRNVSDTDLIKFDCDFAKINMDYFSNKRVNTIELRLDPKRTANYNKTGFNPASSVLGKFTAIVFAPVHLKLIQEGPNLRRKFVDGAICQLIPRYSNILDDYRRILLQRNQLLKQCSQNAVLKDNLYETIAIWSEKLALAGGEIYIARNRYIKKLEEAAKKIYKGLSLSREEISITYEASIETAAGSAAEYVKDLSESQKTIIDEEIYKKQTLLGPHRDDIIIKLDGKQMRTFGSQGQQRSAALTLKLAEAELLTEITGEKPVAILDDVMSELDVTRQDYILNHLHERQVFISCCDPSQIERLVKGKLFHINEGKIKE